MRDLDLDDPNALLSAFEERIEGLFLSPVRVLAKCSDTEEGALFRSFGHQLRNGARDIRVFAYFVREQFQREVESARAEGA